MDTNKTIWKTFFLLLIIVISSAACGNSQSNIHLPIPDNKCKVELHWHGLKPGQSTREDVVEVLGMPFEKGKLNFGKQSIAYYAYQPEGGEISKYAFDRIFFRSDGLIDWMEIIEADRSGSFIAIFDVVSLVGNTIDTMYLNNNYRPENHLPDVVYGPDQIYVWSECGLIIDALPRNYSHAFQASTLECQANKDLCSLVARHPNPYNVGGDLQPDVNNVILMKFYFQPTSYEGFSQYYMYKIPYGLWREYLAENK